MYSGPLSNATTSSSGDRLRAVLAALMPAASPPMISNRSAMAATRIDPFPCLGA